MCGGLFFSDECKNETGMVYDVNGKQEWISDFIGSGSGDGFSGKNAKTMIGWVHTFLPRKQRARGSRVVLPCLGPCVAI
jgi:hypothetical protein